MQQYSWSRYFNKIGQTAVRSLFWTKFCKIEWPMYVGSLVRSDWPVTAHVMRAPSIRRKQRESDIQRECRSIHWHMVLHYPRSLGFYPGLRKNSPPWRPGPDSFNLTRDMEFMASKWRIFNIFMVIRQIFGPVGHTIIRRAKLCGVSFPLSLSQTLAHNVAYN